MEYVLQVKLKDGYNYETDDEITVFIPNGISDASKQTLIEDVVTSWVYDIAYERAPVIWRELGGGTDWEYDRFFEKYIENCSYSCLPIGKE